MPRRAKKTKPPRDREPLVYEVRLGVEPEIERDFDRWLGSHAREMLALPGFFDARIIRAEPDDDGRARRIVRYRLRDRAALEDYLRRHAPRMRAEGLKRFGERFRAERDVYAALPERGGAGQHRCANCGAAADAFCPVCGQEQKDMHVSFWQLLHDFLGDVFTFDSRLARSLRPLLARPGLLTREYLEGRRARYIPPLRLYLFVSIVFFGLLSLMSSDIQLWSEPAAPGPDRAAAGQQRPADAGPRFDLPDIEDEAETDLQRRFLVRSHKVSERPDLFLKSLLGNLPVMMFLLLPVYALILRLLFPTAGFVYVEHLIFGLHVRSFSFIVFTFLLVVNWTASRYAPTALLWPWQALLLGYLLVYPWLAMKRAYGQGFFLTTFKYLVLSVTDFAFLTAAIVATSMATLYWF